MWENLSSFDFLSVHSLAYLNIKGLGTVRVGGGGHHIWQQRKPNATSRKDFLSKKKKKKAHKKKLQNPQISREKKSWNSHI
jgi:hypothetical protein